MIEKEELFSLVKLVTTGGVQILEIDDSFFTVTEFIPGDRNTHYHRLKGKHITKILRDHLGIGVNSLPSVLQKIEQLPEHDLQYSLEYKWKWIIK